MKRIHVAPFLRAPSSRGFYARFFQRSAVIVVTALTVLGSAPTAFASMPVITSVTPSSGATAGGTSVTISGSDFLMPSLYGRPVTITSSSALTDYQVPITIDTGSLIAAGKMRADCGDIRVNDSYGANLFYWLEEDTSNNGCGGSATTVWVKVPAVNSGSTTIYVTYGSGVTSASDGTNTFTFFDDFDSGTAGSALSASLWPTQSGGWEYYNDGGTKVARYNSGGAQAVSRALSSASFSDGVAVEYRARASAAGKDLGTLMYFDPTDTSAYGKGYYLAFGSSGSLPQIGKMLGGTSYTTLATGSGSAPLTYTNFKDTFVGGVSKYYYNGTVSPSPLSTSDSTYTSGRLGLYTWNTNTDTAYFDWIFARKLVAVEPSVSLGAESSMSVTFGGTAATNVTWVSNNTITATTPAHAAGSADVSLINVDGGNTTLTAGYTFTDSTCPVSGTNVTISTPCTYAPGTYNGLSGTLTIAAAVTMSASGPITFGNGVNVTVASGGSITETGTSLVSIAGTLVVQNGGVITHAANTASAANTLNLSAGVVQIDAGGTVTADGLGYTANNGTGKGTTTYAGGGYGGNGNLGTSGGGGVTYGSVTQPTDLGSGPTTNQGGVGGGAIKLASVGGMTINGTVTAAGTVGGAGGSVWLQVGTALAGSGSVSANGGARSSSSASFGSGGGGRVAVYYQSDTSSLISGGTITAYGGVDPSNVRNGGAGSVYLKSNSAPNGDVIFNNNNHLGAVTTQVTTAVQTYDNITIKNGTQYVILNTFTLTAASAATFLGSSSVHSALSVNAGGTLNLPSPGSYSFPYVDVTASGAISGVTGDVTFTGANLTLAASFTGINNFAFGSGGGALTLNSGATLGAAASTITSTGSVTMNTGSTWNGGNVTLSNTGVLTLNSGSSLTGSTLLLGNTGVKTLAGTIVGTSATVSGSAATVTGAWNVQSTTVSGVNMTIASSKMTGAQDLTIASGGTFTQNDANALLLTGTLWVQSGGTLTHTANTTAQSYKVNIAAATVQVDTGGTVNVDTVGFAASNGPGKQITTSRAAGYGGNGGIPGQGGVTYGSVTQPTDIGSGGYSGKGAGAIKLVASGAMTINGVVTASSAANTSGAGSGGSIWLQTGSTLSGSGYVYANGGTGQGFGGAGGGRIAIYYQTDASTIISGNQVLASGGYSSSYLTAAYDGGAGTIYLKSTAATNGDLVIDNHGYLAGPTTQVTTASQTYDSVTIKNGAAYVVPSAYTLSITSTGTLTGGGTGSNLTVSSGGTFNPPASVALSYLTLINSGTIGSSLTSLTIGSGGVLNPMAAMTISGDVTVGSGGKITQQTTGALTISGTLDVQSGGLVNHATNSTSRAYTVNIAANQITLETGSNVNVNSLGYAANQGSGAAGTGSGGASHGGDGWNGTTPIYAYDSVSAPVDLGSGGGTGTNGGGSGGGAIQLTSTGNMIVNGTLSANGTGGSTSGSPAGGPGAGGSIWLNVGGALSGSGTLTADGGARASNGSQPGAGGGRIALTYGSTAATLTMHAYGGDGGSGSAYAGGAGTIYSKVNTNTYGDLLLDNNNLTTGVSVQVAASESYYDLTVKNGANYEVRSARTLTITAAHSILGSTGTLTIDSGGTLTSSASQLTVSTNVTLSGTLNVTDLVLNSTLTDYGTISGIQSLTVNSGGTFVFGNNATLSVAGPVLVNSGGAITQLANTSATKTYAVSLSATDITIATGGSVNVTADGAPISTGTGAGSVVSGKGSGGGYGGQGGNSSTGAVGGSTYGSASLPTDIGSGGGGNVTYTQYSGGQGGGAIQLIGSGTVTIGGSLIADGNAGIYYASTYTGGGSGGSILIQAPNINCQSGGVVHANGGSASSATYAGGGGGGRVAFAYTSSLSNNCTIAALAGSGYQSSAVAGSVDVNNPAPVLSSISPASANAGGADTVVTLVGSGFTNSSVGQWNGSSRATTFVSDTQLTMTVLAADLTLVGPSTITVYTPAPGGGTSAGQTFTVLSGDPTIASITPTSAYINASFVALTVDGTNFTATSVVKWNGTALTTTFLSDTQLSATIPGTDLITAGAANITVADGAATSAATTFTVLYPTPSVTALSPSSAYAGDPSFTLTVTGLGFVPSSVVQWNGASLVTTYVNDTTLTVPITDVMVAATGTEIVHVTNPAPGGGSSNDVNFLVVSRQQGNTGNIVFHASVMNIPPTADVPVVSNVSNGNPISTVNLVAGSDETLYVHGLIADQNGCETLTSVAVKVYLQDVGSNCTPDGNSCAGATTNVLTNCTPGTTGAQYEVAIPMPYNMEPTDTGAPYAGKKWYATATVADSGSAQGIGTSAGFDVASLIAFDVTSSINYGTVNFGQTSAKQSLTFTNKGNRMLQAGFISSGPMVCQGGGSIPSENTHISLSATDDYSIMSPISSSSQTVLALGLTKKTTGSTDPTASMYAQFQMPLHAGVSGVCSNTVTFNATAQ